ncbi:MAG: FxsA family protein [Pseudomonadota bacterium]
MPINPLFFLALFIAVPIVEIALLIQLGSAVGLFPTIGLVIATAVIGTILLRQQGFGVIARATESMQGGKPPIEPVIEGVFLLLAGAFLLTPGLMTDAVGFTLLVPTARRAAAKWVIKRVLAAGVVNVSTFGSDGSGPQGPGPEPSSRPRRGSGTPDVIDGEFERIDEKTYRPDDR